MKKFTLLFCLLLFIATQTSFAQTTGAGSRMNEIFQVTELTAPSGTNGNTRFYDPWEITYGPDDSLWITEAKNYKVYKMSTSGGKPRLILNISQGSTFLPTADQTFNMTFPTGFPTLLGGGYSTLTTNAPQGGLAGLAIHPKFLSGSPYVFISYIWKFVKSLTTVNKTVTATPTGTTTTTTTGTPANGGVYYKNALVRFTFDFTTGLLGSPMMVCDSLPGSSDHNSQRIIIAPIGATYYLFYANGDMGAGQFGNAARVENAQNLDSYEGKILRFNVDPDADADSYAKWIPDLNPFNITLGKQSAVWAFGFRNNQGFAYAKIKGNDILYGQMHGPFSDDEINVIHSGGNYGHPLVVGYKKDGNYNNAGAGNAYVTWGTTPSHIGGLPLIINEAHNADSMSAFHTYYDPIFTYYPATVGSALTADLTNNTAVPSEMASMQYMYYWFNKGQQSNTYWPSEAPSGMDVYTNSMIPGWKNSLISAIMKGAPTSTTSWKVQTSTNIGAPNTPSVSTAASGKLMRLKLNANGDGLFISPTNADSTLKAASLYKDDTVSYFNSVNRFRDLAISPDGLSLFAIIDSSSTTSGPTTTNPINSLCKGCLLKYTFMGYADNGTTSTLPDTIAVATGTANACNTVNAITITSANANTWVPITDTNSNIVAEIYANGNVMGVVHTSFYQNSGTERESGNYHMYMDRNVTITPTTQPYNGNPVKVRLYITNAEYTTLKNATNSKGNPSGISTINTVGIFKNSDVCSSTLTNFATSMGTTPYTRTTTAGATGFALQTSVTSFSTFYFANNTTPLALNLVSFTGSLVNSITQLQWITENENGTKKFVVERSADGFNFAAIGAVAAKNATIRTTYNFPDAGVTKLACTVVYYRLTIVDANDKISYSEIVVINLPGVAGSISIRPNPVINEATIEVDAVTGENANWQLVDNTGRTIMQKNILLVKGKNTFAINLSNLPTGVYYLKIAGGIINQQIKFEKM